MISIFFSLQDEAARNDKEQSKYCVLVGGGHGGQRSGAGRKVGKSTPLGTTDWKKYKKISKKESEKMKKNNKTSMIFS